MRGVVATILVLGSGFPELRSFGARALRAIALPFGTELRPMISLASLTAVLAFAPEFTPRATMRPPFLFGWRICLGDRLGFGLRCSAPFRRGLHGRRRPVG